MQDNQSYQDALATCASEPIHRPGSIQPHGILLVLNRQSLAVEHASANAVPLLAPSLPDIFSVGLEALLGAGTERAVRDSLGDLQLDLGPVYVTSVAPGGQGHHVLLHRRGEVLFLELERAVENSPSSMGNLYPLISASVADLEKAGGIASLCDLAAGEVRRLTGFDKVMIYRFNERFEGQVIAERKAEGMEEYLHQWFPASDIPPQARQLYLLNRIRLIAAVPYQSVPVIPANAENPGPPLDMSLVSLRSVSPIHVQYLVNMGVAASMSISIVVDGHLWGLIACHHREARYLPYDVRTACEFLGRVLGLQIAARQSEAEYEQRVQVRPRLDSLLRAMSASSTFPQGLVAEGDALLQLTGATGAVVAVEGQLLTYGQVPEREDLQQLVAWVGTHLRHQGGADAFPPLKEGADKNDVLVTQSLAALDEQWKPLAPVVSGLLAVCISEIRDDFVLWFRPELVRTLEWGGDPNKLQPADGGKIHPRTSFAAWRETVREQSLPWSHVDQEAARDLRAAILSIVLRRAEKMASLTEELERANKELEAFSYSVSHDLRAPFRHITGLSKLLLKRSGEQLDATSQRYVHSMLDAAFQAGTLVDSLLEFTQMGRSEMHPTRVDMAALVQEVVNEMEVAAAGRTIEWRIGDLPPVYGDLFMLRLVWQNLLSNAVKYTRNRELPVIDIRCVAQNGEATFRVEDNGAGFDMRHIGKLFGVFERLHRPEEFEGTGIGLANVRRLVARHGGRTWAQGAPDQGASFFFTLPLSEDSFPGPEGD